MTGCRASKKKKRRKKLSCDAIAFGMLTVDLDTINLWHIKITGNLLRIINSIASVHTMKHISLFARPEKKKKIR